MIDWPRLIRAITGQPEPVNLPELEYSGEMDIHELSSLLIDRFPEAELYLPDAIYNTCTVTDLERFLKWDKTNHTQYEAQVYDCDDFAWRLKGQLTQGKWASIPFGVIWTEGHALNLFVDNLRRIYFVEPQSDKIQTVLEAWQGSKLRFIGV